MCSYCGSSDHEVLLDLGSQPVANRFIKNPSEPELRHQLKVVLCGNCGTTQLESPIPSEQLVPLFDWITYREPEEHLDALVQQMVLLPDVTRRSPITGITFKDQSTVDRLWQLGFENARVIDPLTDLDISDPNAGIETVESILNPATASRIVDRHGRSDVVLARHILEHAHSPASFLAGLRTLVNPEGYIVIEVPDASRMFDQLDYSAVWEEHLTYFTERSLRSALGENGFEVVDITIHEGGHENLVVAIARPGQDSISRGQMGGEGIESARRFGLAMPEQSARIRSVLIDHQKTAGKIAVLGAGHLSASYINLHGLAELIEFVVDDDPNKQGLLMPGSRLGIVGSVALVDAGITLCLLGINPASEPAVIKRNPGFLDKGGRFASILPASSLALGSRERRRG
jgi:hypothetical protein